MRGFRALSKLAVGLLFFVAASPAFGYLTINTIPQWDGVGTVAQFGPPDTQTYGQLVTAPAGETSLTGFRFLINVQTGGPIQAQAFVYAWDTVNSHLTGAALYQSPTIVISGIGFQPYTVNIPGGAPVTAGQVYVIFFSTSQIAQVNGASQWALLSSNDAYTGGQFVYQNNGTNFGNLSTAAWSSFTQDLAFAVAFGGAPLDAAVVPMLDGSVMVLLAAALALVGALVVRFRQS